MANHILTPLLYRNRPFFIGFFLWIIGFGVLHLLFTQTELIFWVNRNFTFELDLFFKYVTLLGEDYWYLGVLAYLVWQKRSYLFIFLIIWVLKALISINLKYFVDAPRPMAVYADAGLDIHLVSGVNIHTAHSFPSGHTMTAFALACFLSLIVRNKLWGLFFLFLAILVAYSRVYLFQHFPEDVFAGSILGVFVVFIGFWIQSFRLNRLSLGQ